MFYEPCVLCSEQAEVIRIADGHVFVRCPSGHTAMSPANEYPTPRIAQATDWLYLKEAYPVERYVRVRINDKWELVEVVGHKTECIKTGEPAVRIYLAGCGTMLFSREEMDKWNPRTED